MSFYGPIHEFLNGCLPIIGLGGIHLKSKYLGTLLSATSFDADDKLFPLIFGVVIWKMIRAECVSCQRFKRH